MVDLSSYRDSASIKRPLKGVVVLNADGSVVPPYNGAVTVADGADVTQGAKADAAYAGGAGSFSVVSLLKGIYAGLAAATPAGTNKIGGVTEADGDNAALGAKADAAAASDTASSSLIGLVKRMLGSLSTVIANQVSGVNVGTMTGNIEINSGQGAGAQSAGDIRYTTARTGAFVAQATSPVPGTLRIYRTQDGGGSYQMIDETRLQYDSQTGAYGATLTAICAGIPGNIGYRAFFTNGSVASSLVQVWTSFLLTAPLTVPKDVTGQFTKQQPVAPVNRSITASTSSQTLMATNPLRTRFVIKNDSAADVYINLAGAATAAAGSGNIKIAAGAYFEMQGTLSAVAIIGTASAAVTCYEF